MRYFLLAVAVISLGVGLASHSFGDRAARPNVLVIMVDDLGYGDLSSYGAPDARTPHIDTLMGEGMRFNEFYANCCVCSPTRAALLSGRYPEMVGIPGVVRTKPNDNFGFLTPDSIMLPELFQAAGYHTMLIGKWHLGLAKPNRPNQRGFDEFHGFLGDMMDDYWTHRRHGINYMRHNEEEIDPEGHATDLFTQWAIDDLKLRAADGKPFFQFLAYNAPHFPIQPPEEWHERVKAREKGGDPTRIKNIALVEHLDEGIGKVLKTLGDLGLAENTVVVFTSDNGGKLRFGASNGKLRADKTHVYEGGIKVPTCVRWPGKIKAGQQTPFVALTMDILPTLADICGVAIEHKIDGRSFKPLLLEGEQAGFEEPVFHMWLQRGTKEAMRQGDWKLVHDAPDAPFELFNVKDDPYEKRNVAAEHPERFSKMKQSLKIHMDEAQQVTWKRPEGWNALFNGENLDGWEVRGGGDLPPTFEVENGTIVGRTLVPRSNSGFLCTKEQFRDFELTFEVKIDEGLNSGVQIRSASEGTMKGAQVEIESGSRKTGCIFGQGMGMWLSEEIPEKNDAFIKNAWNSFRVLVQGNTIKTWINGRPVEDLTSDKVAAEGVIALQVHAYPRGKRREQGAKEVLSVVWKDIRIRAVK